MGTSQAGPSTMRKAEVRADNGEAFAEQESPDSYSAMMGDNAKRKERDGDGAGDASSDSRNRRQKFTRSRTACYQCRSRKSKCGAQPPDPCGNCIELGFQCQWPEQDGRSARARMARKAKMWGSGAVGAAGSGTSNVDWLDALLRTSTPRSPEMAAASLGVSGMDRMPLMGSLPASVRPTTGQIPPPLHLPPTDLSQPQLPQRPPQPQQSQYQGVGVGFDPNQFIWAVSSRLPIVEDGSPLDHPSQGSRSQSSYVNDTSPKAHDRNENSKIVKVTWWRPHGSTAIAPGLKRITLKVRVDNPSDTWRRLESPRMSVSGPGQESIPLIGPDGAPNPPIMKHLLDVFSTHFGCQYPFIDREDLEAKIDSHTGSVFLLNSIAAIAARFSPHPAIALPDVKVYDYGNVFYSRAKTMLGSMLAVPSRETVTAFVLLASCGFANDSESEVWMMTGQAVRMSIDLGLHLDPPASSSITPEDRRLNRLVFWSVVLMDYALAFGVGRSTTFRSEEITQPIPTQEDVCPGWTRESGVPSSPFPYCAKMMLSYGPLINTLNRSDYSKLEGVISAARGSAINEYNRLPQDMQWHVTNLQNQSRANQASAFLHLHLWLHTILASGYLTGSNVLRRGLKLEMDEPSGIATPRTITTSNLWRNSARTIGDILVLSDIICPLAYCALPFVNQAFFVAACCYVKEIETSRGGPGSSLAVQSVSQSNGDEGRPDTPAIPGVPPDDPSGRSSINISRALLASVASTNISTLQRGLERQNIYWEGTAWISSALKQRVEGMGEIDLVRVTEKLGSFVRLPDAGLVGQKPAAGSEDDATIISGGGVNGNGHGYGNRLGLESGGGEREMFRPAVDNGAMADWFSGASPTDPGSVDFMSSLPFDMATTDPGQNVVEQDVSIPTMVDSQWFN